MKQSAIDKAPIQYFPMDRLYLSPMNPRTRTGADWEAESRGGAARSRRVRLETLY